MKKARHSKLEARIDVRIWITPIAKQKLSTISDMTCKSRSMIIGELIDENLDRLYAEAMERYDNR
jgi:predicted transcriptional regulator